MKVAWTSPPIASGFLAAAAELSSSVLGLLASVGPAPLNLNPRRDEGPPRKKRSAMHVGSPRTSVAAPSVGMAHGSIRPAVALSDSDTDEVTGIRACHSICCLAYRRRASKPRPEISVVPLAAHPATCPVSLSTSWLPVVHTYLAADLT